MALLSEMYSCLRCYGSLESSKSGDFRSHSSEVFDILFKSVRIYPPDEKRINRTSVECGLLKLHSDASGVLTPMLVRNSDQNWNRIM